MNCEELVASLKAQGFDYLSTAECTLLINDAYLIDICESDEWPFLEATREGTAPLELLDLRAVSYVIDATQDVKLEPLRLERLTDAVDPTVQTTGTPEYYYVTSGTTINVYPTNSSDTLQVRYFKTPAELSGTDEPLLPKRFHSLIVDGARARGYENSDDWEL